MNMLKRILTAPIALIIIGIIIIISFLYSGIIWVLLGKESELMINEIDIYKIFKW